MPDNIEQIIRRDLDQLPVLPAEQWIPQSPGRFTVLGRGVKRAALGAVVLVLALAAGTAIGQFRAGVSGVPQVATQPQRTEPIARCSDGRPQSEIDFAGRMLWEPTANEISCVLNATVSGPGANRAYRLTDGRVLNMYERVEAVPVKPTVAPVATGSADVNGATWSWSTLPAGVGQTLLLQGSLAGAPDIELYMALSDQAADLRLLRSIAASLREVAAVVDCGVSDPQPPSIYPASGMECVWKAYAARTPVRWAVTQHTTEGAPVPSTIVFDGATVLVTRDLSLDGFSGTPDRRLWSWRCRTMTQRPWVTDPQRYSFDLSDCTGDSVPAHFP